MANKSYVLKKPLAGIDVSAWQGDIDWQELSHWVDFVIIRGGSNLEQDKFAINNQIACTELGIPYGVYWFSYARTPQRAKEEANRLLDVLHGKQSYPIYLDYETGSLNGSQLEPKVLSEIAYAFCEVLEYNGCYAGIYTNTAFKNNFLQDTFKRFDLWEANWSKSVPARIHQYSNKGRLPGIDTTVDLNLCYYDYPALMQNKGFNGF